MKKIFKLIFLIISIKMNSQDKLKDILSNLEVTDRTYSISSDSMNLKTSKSLNDYNFYHVYRNDLKLLLIKINEYNNYTIYAVLSADKIVLSDVNSLIYFNSLLFYDNKTNRVFLLEYGYDGFPFHKTDHNSYNLTIRLTKNLSRLIEFNFNFEPISCFNFEYLKDDFFIYSCDIYKLEQNSCLVEKLVYVDKVDFNKFSYLERVNENLKRTIVNCSLNDNNILFSFK